MTSEERKSIENCIWMCQTHSKLIDTDTEKYTVELLKQWKKDAEEVSSRALANGDYFTEYYNSNGDNLGVIQQLFDTMIIHGRFDELYAMLQQYKTTLSDRYEEFILRYWIIYDVFCSRKSLTNHVSRYCGLPNKEGVGLSQILCKHCRAVQNRTKIFQGGSGGSCCRLVYKITAV